jgi:hypothetical protein
MEKRLTEAITSQGTGTRATIEAEVNRIDMMDKIRNGKIAHNESELEILQRETRIARWCQRNKRLSAIIAIIVILGVMVSYQSINIKQSIEKHLKIELKEDT